MNKKNKANIILMRQIKISANDKKNNYVYLANQLLKLESKFTLPVAGGPVISA